MIPQRTHGESFGAADNVYEEEGAAGGEHTQVLSRDGRRVLTKNIPCPRPGCTRVYCSETALRNHIRRNHQSILDIPKTRRTSSSTNKKGARSSHDKPAWATKPGSGTNVKPTNGRPAHAQSRHPSVAMVGDHSPEKPLQYRSANTAFPPYISQPESSYAQNLRAPAYDYRCVRSSSPDVLYNRQPPAPHGYRGQQDYQDAHAPSERMPSRSSESYQSSMGIGRHSRMGPSSGLASSDSRSHGHHRGTGTSQTSSATTAYPNQMYSDAFSRIPDVPSSMTSAWHQQQSPQSNEFLQPRLANRYLQSSALDPELELERLPHARPASIAYHTSSASQWELDSDDQLEAQAAWTDRGHVCEPVADTQYRTQRFGTHHANEPGIDNSEHADHDHGKHHDHGKFTIDSLLT